MDDSPRWHRLFRLRAIPAWILSLSAVLWQLVGVAGDVDFLLSLWARVDGAVLIAFLRDWGWVLTTAIGFLWLFRIAREPTAAESVSAPATDDRRATQVRTRSQPSGAQTALASVCTPEERIAEIVRLGKETGTVYHHAQKHLTTVAMLAQRPPLSNVGPRGVKRIQALSDAINKHVIPEVNDAEQRYTSTRLRSSDEVQLQQHFASYYCSFRYAFGWVFLAGHMARYSLQEAGQELLNLDAQLAREVRNVALQPGFEPLREQLERSVLRRYTVGPLSCPWDSKQDPAE